MDTATLTTLKRIWIIDDNDIDVLIGAKTLERFDASIHVQSFTRPLDAIKLLQNQTTETIKHLPDLIFLDLYMPLIDGWQFLQEFETIMNQIGHHTTRVVVTSNTSNEKDIPKKSEHPQVIGHILKPISMENIKEIQEQFFI